MIEELPICECGCGEPVAKDGNRFIHGHNGRNNGKRISKYYSDHPEAREKARLRTIDQFAPQEVRDATSKRSTEVWKNPEYRNAQSERMIRQWADPEYRNMQSEAQKQYYHDHPEVLEEMSEKAKNSKTYKANHEKQKGGKDICYHHIAYDFLRSDALIVKITRKFHSQIHHPKGIQFGTRGYSLID